MQKVDCKKNATFNAAAAAATTTMMMMIMVMIMMMMMVMMMTTMMNEGYIKSKSVHRDVCLFSW